ncbi:MAG: hypothetical protein ABWW65_00700 [Thermoprotei archaeon]
MFLEGLIIVLDLDKFEEYVTEHGLDPYKPNIVTGTLTRLVEDFAIKWRGIIIYGLDYERGTEEAVIEIPYGHEHLDDIMRDLEKIKEEINKLGVSISIAVVKDYVYPVPARDRREAYYGTPGRRRAVKLLRSIKRSGGNKIAVLA